MNLGITRFTADKLLSNSYNFINLEHISTICKAINCTPNDILVWKEDKNQPLPEGHQLKTLKREDQTPITNRIESLSLVQIEALGKYLDDLEKKKG